jgi:hypothetical protein
VIEALFISSKYNFLDVHEGFQTWDPGDTNEFFSGLSNWSVLSEGSYTDYVKHVSSPNDVTPDIRP